MRLRTVHLSLLLLTALGARAYDPLAVTENATPKPLDIIVKDATRKREIPLLVYLPATTNAAPVVLFSHGLGGTRHGSAYLGRHWSARGYAAVFLQHPGSDDSVWRGQPAGGRMAKMEAAASGENFLLRVKDVPMTLDQLATWNADPASPLRGRLDLKRVAMTGHSFGAVTTQAVSGQKLSAGLSVTDPRIKAAVLFSPSGPRRGGRAEQSFGSVEIPWLLMTGTLDVSRIGGITLESRLSVYPALPAGGKYELVLDGAEHSAFTERALAGDRGKRNPNHHRAILALSTAFLDAYLKDDATARAWLNGPAARNVLEKGDRWQRK